MNTAETGRDSGIAAVSRTNPAWTAKAREMTRTILSQPWEGQGENLRFALINAGLEAPHHPNCWGALIMWAVRQGLLVDTGHVLNTSDAPSHASYTKVYRSAA